MQELQRVWFLFWMLLSTEFLLSVIILTENACLLVGLCLLFNSSAAESWFHNEKCSMHLYAVLAPKGSTQGRSRERRVVCGSGDISLIMWASWKCWTQRLHINIANEEVNLNIISLNFSVFSFWNSPLTFSFLHWESYDMNFPADFISQLGRSPAYCL